MIKMKESVKTVYNSGVWGPKRIDIYFWGIEDDEMCKAQNQDEERENPT